MNVYVPSARFVKTQQQALDIEGIQPHYVPMPKETSYWEMMKRCWEAEERFILLEHDIIPWPGALKELWDCPAPWCAHPYSYGGRLGYGFGCVKFSRSAIVLDRSIWDRMPDHSWRNLDSQFLSMFKYLGRHDHNTAPLIHLNKEHEHFTVRETENPNSYRAKKARAAANG